jgi:hypothetical protein
MFTKPKNFLDAVGLMLTKIFLILAVTFIAIFAMGGIVIFLTVWEIKERLVKLKEYFGL